MSIFSIKSDKNIIFDIYFCLGRGIMGSKKGEFAMKRIEVLPIVSRIEDPENAPKIYNELCDDPNFPMGTVFDWRNV